MTGSVNAYNQIQKIPQIQVVVTFNVLAGATQDLYTCPAGKKALFQPLNWSATNNGGPGDVQLQIRRADTVIVFVDDCPQTFAQNRQVQTILLLAGDKLQAVHTNNTVTFTVNVSSGPLELPA
jgi:hypothetical protein